MGLTFVGYLICANVKCILLQVPVKQRGFFGVFFGGGGKLFISEKVFVQ